MKEAWRELRIGDRIRLVQMPSEFDQPGYYVHRETRRVYKRLLERRRSLRIREIDDSGRPWVLCQFRCPDGSWEVHFLAFDHDGWVRIKRRRSAKRKVTLEK